MTSTDRFNTFNKTIHTFVAAHPKSIFATRIVVAIAIGVVADKVLSAVYEK